MACEPKSNEKGAPPSMNVNPTTVAVALPSLVSVQDWVWDCWRPMPLKVSVGGTKARPGVKPMPVSGTESGAQSLQAWI